MNLKFNDQNIRRLIIANIKGNLPLSAAATRSGISAKTLKRWLSKGYQALINDDNGLPVTKEDAEYVQFYLDYSEAEGAAQADLLYNLQGTDDWRASAWLLERRHKDFHEKKKIELAVNDVKENLLNFLEEKLDKETFSKVITALLEFEEQDD